MENVNNINAASDDFEDEELTDEEYEEDTETEPEYGYGAGDLLEPNYSYFDSAYRYQIADMVHRGGNR